MEKLLRLKFKARVEVRIRRDQVDPESETIRKSLFDLGFQLSHLKTSKLYDIYLDAETKKEAENSIRSMCTRLLVNPVKDDYSIEVEQVGTATQTKS